MSLFTLTVPWLAVRPDVRTTDEGLTARTPLWARLLCLGAYDRQLIVDRDLRLVMLWIRRWWVSDPEIDVPFNHIEYIVYTYDSIPISFVQMFQGNYQVTEVSHEIDWFNVALKIRDRDVPLLLFRFLGEGSTAVRPFPLLGMEGDQEGWSLSFVHQLRYFLGAKISSPIYEDIDRASAPQVAPCPHCGKNVNDGAETLGSAP